MTDEQSRRRWLRQSMAAALLSGTGLKAQAVTHSREQRIQQLLPVARDEGPLMVYHVTPSFEMDEIAKAFKARLGLDVRAWKSTLENVIQRAVTETRSGKPAFDLLQIGPTASHIYGTGVLQAVAPILARNLPDALVPAHGEWVATNSAAFVFAFNPRLVGSAELPVHLEDLAHSRWSGRIGFDRGSQEWYTTACAALGEPRSNKLFATIAKNGLQVRDGGKTLMATLVAAGELDCSVHVLNHTAELFKRQGAAIDYRVIAPVITNLYGWSVGRSTPRPASVALLLDFLTHEGQDFYAARHYIPALVDRAVPQIDRKSLLMVDPALVTGEAGREWRRKYQQFLAVGLKR